MQQKGKVRTYRSSPVEIPLFEDISQCANKKGETRSLHRNRYPQVLVLVNQIEAGNSERESHEIVSRQFSASIKPRIGHMLLQHSPILYQLSLSSHVALSGKPAKKRLFDNYLERPNTSNISPHPGGASIFT